MKKIILTLAMIAVLGSCKKETPVSQPVEEPKVEELQARSSQDSLVLPVSPVLNPEAVVPPDFYENNGVYDGVGVVTQDGEMDYNILMPELKSGSYSFVEFYNLGNNVLFMQMQDPDFQPLSNNALYTLRENIMPLGFDLERDISVFLYFENGRTLTKAEALRVYAKGCKGVSEPKKCGTGVVNFINP